MRPGWGFARAGESSERFFPHFVVRSILLLLLHETIRLDVFRQSSWKFACRCSPARTNTTLTPYTALGMATLK